MNEEDLKGLKLLLDKIPVDKLYDDLFSPPLKKVGELLSNVIGVGNIIPKLANARSEIYLENNLKKYKEKLDQIPEDDLQKVPEQIGLPIIDKLTSTNDENLSNAFINLLTKASSKNNVATVHPSFVSIIDNLSVDEAILLFKYKNQETIPCIDIVHTRELFAKEPPKQTHSEVKSREELLAQVEHLKSRIPTNPVKVMWNLTGIEYEEDIKLYFPQNIDLYLDNLQRLGIISFSDGRELKRRDEYEKLKDFYKKVIDDKRNNLPKDTPTDKHKIIITYRFIEFTSFGQAFINAAIKDIGEKSEEVD